MRPRSGFILIIVLAVLGILAYLALSLVEQSRLARILSRAYILESQTKLVARSGIEKGKQWILKPFLDGGSPSQAEPMAGLILPVSVPLDGQLSASVRVDDSSGRICINDGMKAGQAELKNLYNPQALDPWPDLPAPRKQDVSAWINIRLRSLLNAYGDVQRFAAFQLPNSISTKGWPAWQGTDTSSGIDTEPTYNGGGTFMHSATDTGDRFTSIPPCWFDGTITPPATSAGLGDRIIGARSAKGYTDVEQIRDIVNQWWADTKPALNAEVDLFARVSSDFTIAAWHDPAFWRMKREFGGNHGVFTDQAYYYNSSELGPGATNAGIQFGQDLEVSPPDFTDLWRPHPVPPINLNAASDAVRAAVFQAPVNISLHYEGAAGSSVTWQGVPYNYTPGSGGPLAYAYSPHITVRSPLVHSTNLLENGYKLNTGSFLTQLQRNRLLSVRDAMICAQAYRHVADDPLVGWPASFERLAKHFRHFLINGDYQVRLIERARKTNLNANRYGKPSDFDQHNKTHQQSGTIDDPRGAITQWVMSEFFPHIFSCQRRLPSWMGAPLALLSPWRRFIANGSDTSGVCMLEDFVFRSPLPKVTFQPTGVFLLESNAVVERGPMKCRRRILAVVQAYEQTVLRDQDSFRAVNDTTATSGDVLIGPELDAAISSPYLGTVGLQDRGEEIPGGTMLNQNIPVLGARFDLTAATGFVKDGSSSFTVKLADGPTDKDNLPDSPPGSRHVGPGNENEELINSALEGPALSIFPRAGMDACDLSPFGGMLFSSFNSGTRSATPFGDAFYFRPNTFLTPLGFSSHTGTKGNSGLISLWYRIPAGIRDGTLMHMVLWEKMWARLASPVGAVEERLRPIYFHLLTNSRDAVFSVASGHWGLTGNGPVPDSGYYFQPWPQLQSIRLPLNEADYTSDPVFKSMMPRWAPTSEAGSSANYWFNDMLTHTSAGACEPQVFRSRIQPISPYSQRAGGWSRVVARWDFGKHTTNENKIELIAHLMPEIQFVDIGVNDGLKLFNPKMVMSFGEVQYQVRPALPQSTILPPTYPLGSLVPVHRLNSCIDNIVFQFGGFPNADFETDPTTAATYSAAETKMYNAVQDIPGFNNRRYNIRPAGHALGLAEPVWVINPKLPSGSKVLQFGARIYDVPFYPYFDSMFMATPLYRIWTVLAPRVDLSFTDALGNVKTPTRSALPIWDQGKNTHSSAWSSYPIRDSKDARFRLTYRSVDAMDRPLTEDVLSDIPWIQEVNWAWIPPTGMRFLSWKEE